MREHLAVLLAPCQLVPRGQEEHGAVGIAKDAAHLSSSWTLDMSVSRRSALRRVSSPLRTEARGHEEPHPPVHPWHKRQVTVAIPSLLLPQSSGSAPHLVLKVNPGVSAPPCGDGAAWEMGDRGALGAPGMFCSGGQ